MNASNGTSDGRIPRRHRSFAPVSAHWRSRANTKRAIVGTLIAGIVLVTAGIFGMVWFPLWASGFGAIPLFVTIAIGGRLTALSMHALLNLDRTQT